jgi:succinoglycan biosynthesis protein ExoA
MGNDYPLLSIVIPALNEEQFIAQTVNSLLNQDYPREKVEILVVVADSVDRTEDIVKAIAAEEPRVKYARNPYGLSSGARTIGTQKSTGEIVIFIDAHVYIDNNQLLKNTVRLMGEKQVSILSRPQLLDTPHNSFFQHAVSLARTSWIGHGRDSTIYLQEEKYVDPGSSGASYRREVFERVGFFDLAFDACEDVEFNYRCSVAGFRSYTSMKLAIYYYPRTGIRSLFRQMSRYGTGRFRLARKHPGTLSLTTLLPSMMLLIPPLMIVLGLTCPVLVCPCMIPVIAYLTAILLFSARLAVRHGWTYFFALPAVYLTLHTGLGWGFLREFSISLLRPFRQTPVKKKAPF